MSLQGESESRSVVRQQNTNKVNFFRHGSRNPLISNALIRLAIVPSLAIFDANGK